MTPTTCPHKDKKSHIRIINNGEKRDLLSCNNCTKKLESFSTIEVLIK